MRAVDTDEVAAEGGTRSCGRNMVRVRILRMPRIEVETHRKAVKPPNPRDRQARVLGRMMPQSPRKSPQNAVFRVFSKIPRSRKNAPRKNRKGTPSEARRLLAAEGLRAWDRVSAVVRLFFCCRFYARKGEFDATCGRLLARERIRLYAIGMASIRATIRHRSEKRSEKARQTT